jgi:hypothetical protein
LLNHACSCVGTSFQTDYERLHNNDREGRISSFIIRVNETEKEMFRWIEWVVMLYQPLSIVDDPLTRDGMRYKPIKVASQEHSRSVQGDADLHQAPTT